MFIIVDDAADVSSFSTAAAAAFAVDDDDAPGGGGGNRFDACNVHNSSTPCSIGIGSSGGSVVGLLSLLLLLSLFVVLAAELATLPDGGRGVEDRCWIIRAK